MDYAKIRADLRESDREIGPEVWAVIAFCEERSLTLVADSTVNLWGFGEIPVNFRAEDGVWWTPLVALVEPTGIPYDRLEDLMVEEPDSDDVGWVQYVDNVGEYVGLPFVSGHFVLRLFASESPWQTEFMDNTQNMMRHGLRQSGLVERMEGHNREIAEWMVDDLPSVEVARHEMHSGPIGALNREGRA